MDVTTVNIGFLGFGNMASAIADGWLAAGTMPAERLYACAKHYDALCERTAARGMHACETAEELVDAADIVVIAIKPYLIEGTLPALAPRLAGKVVVSVAAGWTSEDYERVIPGVHHISVMPNTPVAVCEGLVALETAHTLTPEEHRLVEALFKPLGTVVEVETRLLSVAGPIGGCTPAFLAMMIEALADAAVKYGIPRATAYKMVSQAVAGTGRLQLATGTHPGAMKDAVCSPGGTTIRGVAELERAGMRSAFIRAIDAIEGK